MKYASMIHDCLEALLIEASAEDIANDFHASSLFNYLNKKLELAYEIDSIKDYGSFYEALVLEYPRHSPVLWWYRMKINRKNRKVSKLLKKFYK